jgi:hypothetical protein
LHGLRFLTVAGALVIVGLGAANLRAQSVLGDPKDAHKVFANTCSACHKSPQGLAKNGQVASFLRQHYTTSPEMSAAMAAYLVSAGSGPAKKEKEKEKTAATSPEGPAAKMKAKKQEQLTAAHPAGAEGAQPVSAKQSLRKQRHPQPAAEPSERAARPPVEPVEGDQHAVAAVSTLAAASSAPATTSVPAATSAPAATAPAGPPPVVLDIPLPDFPSGPPADLTQSAFSSSPVP